MARLEELPPIQQAAKHVDRMGYVTVCGIAPAFAEGLTWFDVSQTSQYLSMLEDVMQWCLADLISWCFKQEGDTQHKLGLVTQVLEMAQVEMKVAEVLAYAKASRLWGWEYRQSNDILSFRHHVAVAHLPPSVRQYWLRSATEGNWSLHQLKTEMYNANKARIDSSKGVYHES